MKAIHFKTGGGAAADCLEVTNLEKPQPEANDLLVNIKATSVNPVDTKIREGKFPASQVTGYDAAGVVEAVGSLVNAFKVGDEVYYAGVLGRQGTMAQYSLVDHRVAAKKPKNLDWIHAAAVPLVSLTAWEMLEEQMGLQPDDPKAAQSKKSILIINGAGGVGSVATQLSRKVFKLSKVIVTASREETRNHAMQMGATHTIDHHKDLEEQLKSVVGIDAVDYIFICHSTSQYMQAAVELAAPKGRIGSIVETDQPLPGLHDPKAFMKALTFSWELMFTKGAFQIDLQSQGDILARVAKLFDAGVLTSLVTESSELSVKNLVKAHEKLESGKTIGKIAFSIGDDLN